jgi:hypothetical protein
MVSNPLVAGCPGTNADQLRRFGERTDPEETVPHRRGSFQEDGEDLLARFAHRGTPAALEDQIDEAKSDQEEKSRREPAWASDPHRALRELANREAGEDVG